ncbi:gp289 [Sphingomonas phage PAU]|uniref:gp289 n=1 Tax=Sphingomonas phage PAU TaxID=1150991 RepID=UPI00025734A0|nr:gp289 [Sphingomonas phage PAU]AFF28287.1 gp289 [Sphingomonas phage PAU]
MHYTILLILNIILIGIVVHTISSNKLSIKIKRNLNREFITFSITVILALIFFYPWKELHMIENEIDKTSKLFDTFVIYTILYFVMQSLAIVSFLFFQLQLQYLKSRKIK